MRIVHKIGLEAEFILLDDKGKMRFPAKHGFSHDEFFLLGEFRADPGSTREETIGYYMKALAQVLYLAKEKKLTADFSGVWSITPEMKADILRKMSSKTVPECKNIYGIDILKFSDDVVEGGTIKECRISAGLHVHFSRWIEHEWTDKDGRKQTAWKSILTPSQMKKIITSMDSEALQKYTLGVPLKYRQKGFYEIKPYGFEYRSLPMVPAYTYLENVMSLVDLAFCQLENLDK